ncbi:uncharacterized protein LOC128160285 [Crassostrea angulata]|uniref:uncharacterized protein LOC128160285 n=1 Tax=Magallana angulata TaxID=2784310 RepID=UPI0022B1B057|nr:uncharacterized protein LOC128160285 [Crassostrea angulata]
MAMLPLITILLTSGSLCHSQFTFKYSLTRDESSWKREETEYGHSIFKRSLDCPPGIYFCPETSPLVLQPGDPSKGHDFFREGYFDDVCSYFPEFIECAKNYHYKSNPFCEDIVRDYASILTLRERTLCKSPILPVAKEIRECLNNKVTQLLTLYEQVRNLIHAAVWNIANHSKETFCPPYKTIIEETITELKTCDKYGFKWSEEKETILRNYYYPALSYLALPFQCDDL